VSALPSLLEWSADLETGNEYIDSQHRMLLLLARKLELAYEKGAEHRVVVGLCLELKKFTDFHFLSEENVMREVGYPGFEQHAKAHSHLLFELDVWIQKVNRGTEPPTALLRMVASWLIGHLSGDDKRLAEYIMVSPTHAVAQGEYGLYLR
jgi:hemerythrin-like metal-binding protein